MVVLRLGQPGPRVGCAKHCILTFKNSLFFYHSVVGYSVPPRGDMAMSGDIFGCHSWVGARC